MGFVVRGRKNEIRVKVHMMMMNLKNEQDGAIFVDLTKKLAVLEICEVLVQREIVIGLKEGGDSVLLSSTLATL